VKIYLAAVEALGKKEREGETQETIKWFLEFHPPLNSNVFFCRLFFNLTVYDQTQGTGTVFS
jgi:hypothetical protein